LGEIKYPDEKRADENHLLFLFERLLLDFDDLLLDRIFDEVTAIVQIEFLH
jgi:hypothetical protein